MAQERSHPDSVNSVIKTILTTSIALLGVCIPLVAITKLIYLPMLVILGAFTAASIVWTSKPRVATDTQSAEKIAELEKTVADLQERLANVETINHFERAMAEKAMTENSEDTTTSESSVATMG